MCSRREISASSLQRDGPGLGALAVGVKAKPPSGTLLLISPLMKKVLTASAAPGTCGGQSNGAEGTQTLLPGNSVASTGSVANFSFQMP